MKLKAPRTITLRSFALVVVLTAMGGEVLAHI